MKIDRALLDKTAHLARLEFDEESADAMMADMTKIITWVEKLSEVDTEGVAPLTTMSHEINRLREDCATSQLSHEKAMKNAPDKDDNYFRVPKIMD